LDSTSEKKKSITPVCFPSPIYEEQTIQEIPNPGTDQAVKLGCRCPVFDKASDGMFWINADCMIHGTRTFGH